MNNNSTENSITPRTLSRSREQNNLYETVSGRRKNEKIRIGSLNVRTFVKPEQRACALQTMTQYQVDLLCVSETRTPEKEVQMKHPYLRYAIYTFLNNPDTAKPGYGGVGFILSPKAHASLLNWTNYSPRVTRIRVAGKPKNWTIISVYSPTNQATDSEIEEFYDLKRAISTAPKQDILLVFGD